MLETKKYVRKPFVIEAVRLTEENFDEVVAWTQGVVHTEPRGRYIFIDVQHTIKDKQKKAYVGDWVLFYPSKGFKIYTHNAFNNQFDENETQTDTEEPGFKSVGEMAAKLQETLQTTSDSKRNVFSTVQPNAFQETDSRVPYFDGDYSTSPVDPKDNISGKR